MPQLHANALLNERYRVSELLAMGGMAEVWVAQDTLLERPVAVKVLRAGVAEDLAAADRLRAEAKLAAKVKSDHVVRVHDVGEVVDADGRRSPYLVMELVDGETLRDHMLRGPLDPEQVRRYVTQIAGALAEAHALGVIHRDIKPANILVTRSGDCKLTDFGISCSSGAAALTATGLVMGTARYLSPEQVSGKRASAASDVYSLGVVAHEALRGQPLFTTDGDVEAALAHVQQKPPALPTSVPADLAAVVLQMLAKDPAARPTARDVAAGRSRPETLTPTRAIPLVTQRVATQRADRRPRLVLAACFAGLLLACGAALASSGSSPFPDGVTSSPVAPTATPTTAPPTPTAAPLTTVARTVPVTSPRPAAPHRRKHGHKERD